MWRPRSLEVVGEEGAEEGQHESASGVEGTTGNATLQPRGSFASAASALLDFMTQGGRY